MSIALYLSVGCPKISLSLICGRWVRELPENSALAERSLALKSLSQNCYSSPSWAMSEPLDVSPRVFEWRKLNPAAYRSVDLVAVRWLSKAVGLERLFPRALEGHRTYASTTSRLNQQTVTRHGSQFIASFRFGPVLRRLIAPDRSCLGEIQLRSRRGSNARGG